MEKYNYTSDEIKMLDVDSQEYKQLRNEIYNQIYTVDIYNPKIKELVDALNNKELFGDLIKNSHAKLRFISRFVLKDNPNANLAQDIKQKRELLEKELDYRLNNSVRFFPHTLSGAYSPTMFLGNSELGEYVLIGFNKSAQLHTLYGHNFEFVQQQKKAKSEST